VERPHGLPVGTRQFRVTRAGQHQYQDVTYQAYGVVVELDGRGAHPVELRWRDIHRDNATTVAGQLTLRYGWADVSEQPCQVAAQVGAAVQERLGRAAAPLRTHLPDSRRADSRLTSPAGRSTQPPVA
jgi:very-short-patch-repair endonuclease